MIEKFTVRKESAEKNAEKNRENESIARLQAGNFTEQQVQEALLAHSGEKLVGNTSFLNHATTDSDVGEYKSILGDLELHTKEQFVNEGRTARRKLRFSRNSEALETPSETA